MQASKRGAVYWGTLAFGAVFLGTGMGYEVVYYKFMKKFRDSDIKEVSCFVKANQGTLTGVLSVQEKDIDKKINEFTKLELGDGSDPDMEKEVGAAVDNVKDARTTSLIFKSRDEYK